MQMEAPQKISTVKVGTSKPVKFMDERGVSSNYLICLEYAALIMAPLLFIFGTPISSIFTCAQVYYIREVRREREEGGINLPIQARKAAGSGEVE